MKKLQLTEVNNSEVRGSGFESSSFSFWILITLRSCLLSPGYEVRKTGFQVQCVSYLAQQNMERTDFLPVFT